VGIWGSTVRHRGGPAARPRAQLVTARRRHLLAAAAAVDHVSSPRGGDCCPSPEPRAALPNIALVRAYLENRICTAL